MNNAPHCSDDVIDSLTHEMLSVINNYVAFVFCSVSCSTVTIKS